MIPIFETHTNTHAAAVRTFKILVHLYFGTLYWSSRDKHEKQNVDSENNAETSRYIQVL